MSEQDTVLEGTVSRAARDNERGSWSAALMAAAPHLIFSTLFILPALGAISVPPVIGNAISLVVVAVTLFGWRRGWPLWSGSWVGYLFWVLFIYASFLSFATPDPEFAIAIVMGLAGLLLFQRRPLYGLLASFPALVLFTRLFTLELVLGDEWVFGGLWLLMALTAGAIVRSGSRRAAVLLAIGFHLVAGLAFTLGAHYLPYRFPEIGARETPRLTALINDFVPVTLAVVTITLAALLLNPLWELSGRGGRADRRNYRLLLGGMALTLGGVFGLRARPPAATEAIAAAAVGAGLFLSLGVAFTLGKAAWPAAPRRPRAVALPLLAAFAPLVVFSLATPFAPDGTYTESSRIVISLSYAGVILWTFCALWVLLSNGGGGREAEAEARAGELARAPGTNVEATDHLSRSTGQDPIFRSTLTE